jgi:hypothetical protein
MIAPSLPPKLLHGTLQFEHGGALGGLGGRHLQVTFEQLVRNPARRK